MRFSNVSILSLAHVDAPHRVTSAALSDRLAPALSRLGMRADVLESASAIVARRYWDEGVTPSQAATMAAEKALAAAGIDRARVGMLVSTSVCRDFIEPSVACLVHGNLGLSPDCLNFDIGNACLAFLNGMQIVGNMIERGQIDYGLIVDGESAKYIQDVTIERLLRPETTTKEFRDQFATLTLGSGAAAMVLCRSDLAETKHRFIGSVAKAATEHNQLCRGQVDKMETDAKTLLFAGLALASDTWAQAQKDLGWKADELGEFVLHQVSGPHTRLLCETLGLPPEKVLAIYPEFGNIGPASVPIVLSKAVESGRVKAGTRVALMGIGSGLNCSMAEVVW
jgi:3-oxoacyl-[acyl-carrier-protein] synthase III